MDSKIIEELKISYLENRINELPHGWFGTYRGIPVVKIYKDPDNPDVSRTNVRRYYIHTKHGQVFSKLVNEFRKVKDELKNSMEKWKKTYSGKPRIFDFPLAKHREDIISYEYLCKSLPNQNELEPKIKIVYKDQVLRSKNELLAIKEIEDMGFEWKTEIHVQIGDYHFYPDVAFYVPYIDKVAFIELDGMMENDSYFTKSEFRKQKYFKCGFRENRDVIFYRMSSEDDFDVDSFRRAIEYLIELNATNIINPYESL